MPKKAEIEIRAKSVREAKKKAGGIRNIYGRFKPKTATPVLYLVKGTYPTIDDVKAKRKRRKK